MVDSVVWCLAGQVSPLRPDDVLRAAQSMKTGTREDRDARILRHAQEDSPQLQEVARTKLLSMTEKSGDYNLNGTDSDLFKYGMVCCREYLDAWFKLQVCLDPKNHGGLGAPEHKAPPGFDRTKLAKEFSKPATADECKEAGWASSSGKKKKA